MIISIGQSQEAEEIFKKVDEKPRFPGCEDTGKEKSELLRACSTRKMLEYIYSNLKYPAEARQNGIQGQVVIQFIIEKDGSVKEPKLLKDIGAGCGEAALKVINDMNKLPERWRPGMKDGVAVPAYFTVPIRFKLEGASTKSKRRQSRPVKLGEGGTPPPPPPPPAPEQANREVFKVVEQMPILSKCLEVSDNYAEQKDCTANTLQEILFQNWEEPSSLAERKISGQVVFSFVVEPNGKMTDISLLRDIGAGVGSALKKALEELNEIEQLWEPGKQRGQKVPVKYILPLKINK